MIKTETNFAIYRLNCCCKYEYIKNQDLDTSATHNTEQGRELQNLQDMKEIKKAKLLRVFVIYSLHVNFMA